MKNLSRVVSSLWSCPLLVLIVLQTRTVTVYSKVASAAEEEVGCIAPPPGLVAAWPGEERATEALLARAAVLEGSVTYVPGKVGTGFRLNGVDGRILVPNDARLNFGPGQNLSIEGWIQVERDSTKFEISIVDKRLAPSILDGVPFNAAVGYTLYLVDGRLGFQLADAPLGNYRFHDFYSTGADLRDGLFHHVAVTVDRTSINGGALYVDGKVVLTFDPTVAPGDLSNPEPFRIGNHASESYDGFFPGIIDELGLYRRALGAEEVRSIFLAGAAGKCPGVTPAAAAYDLQGDWSNEANPNGPWALWAGSALLTPVKTWGLDAFDPPQPGWAFGSTIPFWFRSASPPTVGGDWLIGDVVVHTHTAGTVNGPTNGIASVTWTSPINGLITVAGAVWEARDIASLGGAMRGNRWELLLRDRVLSSGQIAGGDAYSRANPMRLEVGENGPEALIHLHVALGDVLRLQFIPTSMEGDYVGVDLAVSITETDPLPGMMAHWRFDEGVGTVAHDSAGSFNGNLSSGARFVTNGVAGGALFLSRAQSGFVDMGNVLGLTDTSFSIAVWVKTNPEDRTENSLIVAKHEAGYNNGYFALVNRSNDFIGERDRAAFFAGNAFAAPTSTTVINDGRWHHLVAIHERDGRNLLYLDGVLEGSAPSEAITSSPAAFMVGGASFGGIQTGLFSGWIDELQVYSRALSGNDVNALLGRPAAAPSGTPWVTTIAGSGSVGYQNGTPAAVRFHSPNGGTVGPDQSAYFADTGNHLIRRVDLASGTTSTYAGSGSPGASNGPAEAAQFNQPLAVCIDHFGNLFVADSGNHLIRKISAGSPSQVTLYAGSAERGYLDGPAASARFDTPNDLVVDRLGNVFVTEFGNHTIRKIAPDGTVSTFAGNGSPGFADDFGIRAGFYQPAGIAVDTEDNLYVSEWVTHRIRKVTPQAAVTTLAGSIFPGWLDGRGILARFNKPDGLIVDAAGVVFVADGANHAIRRISPAGDVTTIAGSGLPGYADGLGKVAQFSSPAGITLDSAGTLIVADTQNQRIRRISFLSAPQASIQASNTVVPVGAHVELVAAAAGPGPFLFQWKHDGVELIGQTGAGLVLNAVQENQSGSYSVVVSNPIGSTESAGVELTVLVPIQFKRSLPAYYGAETRLTVQLETVNPVSGLAYAYAVEDHPPSGWRVDNISSGGIYDAANQKVKFGPFFDFSPRVLTYDLVPLQGDAGTKSFAGIVSADGIAMVILGAQSIEPAPPHPADLDPVDFQISANEVTAYAAAWRKGQAWPVAPSPIPINYVTRAGLLWKNGERYRWDPSAGGSPLWWVNRSIAPGAANPKPVRPQQAEGMTSAVCALPAAYVPGEPFLIRLIVQVTPAVSAYALEQVVPAGFTVADVSDEGAFDEKGRTIRWGPFFDKLPRELTARLTSFGIAAPASFEGRISFDGLDATVGGDRLLHAATRLMTLLRSSNGVITVVGSYVAGESYVLEASADLEHWQELGAEVPVDGLLRLPDPEAGGAPHRFYRVRSQP